MEASNNAWWPRAAHCRALIHELFTRCAPGRENEQNPKIRLFLPLRHDQSGEVVGLQCCLSFDGTLCLTGTFTDADNRRC